MLTPARLAVGLEPLSVPDFSIVSPVWFRFAKPTLGPPLTAPKREHLADKELFNSISCETNVVNSS